MSEALDSVLTEVEVTVKKVGDGLTQTQRNIQEYFTEPMKRAVSNLETQGTLSVNQLVKNIILSLTSKVLFDAIDKLAKALEDALSPNVGGSGGGGFLSTLGSFAKGLFGGGKAGGGVIDRPTLVGEEGPEVAFPSKDGASVLNMRQIAFAGSGGAKEQGVVHYNDNRQYHLSGVDTRQMYEYIERGRDDDRRGTAQMLKDNGFGRMG